MPQPKVIFLDAVGTIFGVRGSVGEIYSAIAAINGVNIPAKALNQAFYQAFKVAPPLAFPHTDPLTIPELEYEWWKQVAYQTFLQTGVIHQFADFDNFFTKLYDFFSQGDAWFVYDDVFNTLRYWKNQGIELGIISNFDSRIYEVLDLLGLNSFFSTVTISSSAGFAKPAPEIFRLALEKHECNPAEAWHIGDSKTEDYLGALGVGIKAFLIER
jgi:putative hydrolase of the HAD superfamily